MKKLHFIIIPGLIIVAMGYYYLFLEEEKRLTKICAREIEMTAGLCAFHSALTDDEKEKCRISWYSDRYGYGKVITTYDETLRECIKRKCKPAMGKCLGTF